MDESPTKKEFEACESLYREALNTIRTCINSSAVTRHLELDKERPTTLLSHHRVKICS